VSLPPKAAPPPPAAFPPAPQQMQDQPPQNQPPPMQPPFYQPQPPQAQQQPFPPQAPVPPQQYNQNFAPPQQAPNYYYPQQQPPPVQYQPYQPAPLPPACGTCGGGGQWLDAEKIICKECRWLRPLAPGYAIDCSAFQWAEDGRAMSALRAITPLNAAAEAISEKIGRRWIESTLNGVRLNERQLPEIYAEAVRAARMIGMAKMPDIYISGEYFWDSLTFGTDKDSFIILGTMLAMNFRGDDLLFLLAREMGHCRAGHALWKTVLRFFMGEQGRRKGLMAGGIFAALSPSALIGGAIEMPLLGWARQAEITADRAGLLAVGSEEIARRVLMSWTLKSPVLYRQINVEAWLEQQAAEGDDEMSRFTELTMSSTPYIARRLKLMSQFAQSEDLKRWHSLIKNFEAKAVPAGKSKKSPPPQGGAKGDIRVKCTSCATPLRVPAKVLEGKQQISIRCPNPQCGKLTQLKKQARGKPGAPPAKKAAAPQPAEKAKKSNQNVRSLNYDE
jgi:Zn-dependent protease with chaperone function